MRWEECFRQSFGSRSACLVARSEVSEIGRVDIDRVGRSMTGNDSEDIGMLLLAMLNSPWNSGQMDLS